METKAALGNKKSITFRNWLANQGREWILFGLFLALQCAYFVYSFMSIQNSEELSDAYGLMAAGLPIARSSANVISALCGLILLTVSRMFLSLARKTWLGLFIPFDKSVAFHAWIGLAIVFWSIVHCTAHYINFIHISSAFGQSPENLSISSGPGLTGHIATISLFLLTTAAYPAIRHVKFEVFWYAHHASILFFISLIFHGSFCFIRSNNDIEDACHGGPTFWKWVIGPVILYGCERVIREYRGRLPTTILRVIDHPSNVVELQIEKPSMKVSCGQYVYICCPEISILQWHPFTLTSSPHDNCLSVHIRIVGDWTRELAALFRHPAKSLPYIILDGGYGAATVDVFKFKVVMLIGAGIGVTPYASVLKTIKTQLEGESSLYKTIKVYFFWICRDTSCFEWFQDLLEKIEIENKHVSIDIYTYITGNFVEHQIQNISLNDTIDGLDPITGLKSLTRFGRPNWELIFEQVDNNHLSADVGVFYCGPKPLSQALQTACNRGNDTSRNRNRFFYKKEVF